MSRLTGKPSVRFSQKHSDGVDVRKSSMKVSEEVSIKKKKHVEEIDIYNDPLYNPNGSRNLKIPYDLFVLRKIQEDREKNKKIVKVSEITLKDRQMYESALRKLKNMRRKSNSTRNKYLKSLSNARGPRKPRPIKKENLYCPISCKVQKDDQKAKSKTPSKSNIRSRSKSNDRKNLLAKIHYPVLKKKSSKSKAATEEVKVKKSIHPVIEIPPVKTRKWIPPIERSPAPRPKVVINYPPLKLRKKPWKPKSRVLKKKKSRTRLDKVFYPLPASSLGKTWRNFKFISSNLQILRGTISQYSKKFSFVSNGKQSPFIAAIALSYTTITPMKLWTSKLLDEIISFGDVNFRRQLRFFKHRNDIKACEIKRKIYLKRSKVTIEIADEIKRGIHDEDDTKDLLSQVTDMLDRFTGIVIFYNNQNSAIWKDEKAFYIFNSEDTDEKGRLTKRTRGACCAIRSTELKIIVDYLTETFRISNQKYEIYSFDVLKVISIEEELSKLHTQCLNQKPVVKVKMPKIMPVEEPVEPSPPKEQKTGLAAILFRSQQTPIFGDSFQKSSIPSHGYLTCENYLTSDCQNEAPFISTVAIIMLRTCKSSLWMSSTIRKIFEIGHSIYVENVEKILIEREMKRLQRLEALEPIDFSVLEPPKVINEEDEDFDDEEEEDQEAETVPPLTKEQIKAMRKERLKKPQPEVREKYEIPIMETRPNVEIGKIKLELTFENIAIGRVSSRKSDEISLEVGIERLFKHYDYGLILGPDVVSIWREQNYYFLFDPNHCEGYRRVKDPLEEDIISNSCLNWFGNLKDLVKLYIDNLPKDKKNSVFKICKIETHNFIERAKNWFNFRGIESNKWILSGHISESSEEFYEINRNHQSTCISIVALAKKKELGVLSWTADTVDEIVRLGDEFYTGCVLKLKQENQFTNANLRLDEVGRELMLDKIIINLNFEESVICGKLKADENETHISLLSGLEILFDEDDSCILTACGITLAVFRFDDGYFIFDSHGRDENGRNFKTLDPKRSCEIFGTACVLRFTNLSDLANHLILNFEVIDSSLYILSKVDISVRTSSAPCLYNYENFGDENYAAMLKSFDNWHEDIDHFKYDSIQKTLCNLVSCLSFTKVLNPRYWNSIDINEILKIGYKLLCQIGRASEDIWEKLKVVEICSMNISINLDEETEGVFRRYDKVLPDPGNEEVLEEHVKISEIQSNMEENENQNENEKLPSSDTQQRSSVFPEIPDFSDKSQLSDIISSWNVMNEVYAILSSTLFNIALFKTNNFYYIFDPKASNEDGMLVKKRLGEFIKKHLKNEHDKLLERFTSDEGSAQRMSSSYEFQELIFGRPVTFGIPNVKPSEHVIAINDEEEDSINVNEKGCAYVAWFTSIDLLTAHILSKIPDRFLNTLFTIQYLSLQTEVTTESKMSPWNNFQPVSQNHWILRASFSQSDSQFLQTHRNHQDVPNCIIAMAFSRFCKNHEWNATVLDVILKFGDRLFKKSLALVVTKGPIHSENLTLELSQIDLPVFIRPYMISVSSTLLASDFISSVPMKEVIKNYFASNNDPVLLYAKKYYVAVWKCEDNSFMMFDSHDIGPDGYKKSTGFASLQRFTVVTDIIDIFLGNIKDLVGVNEYKLVKAVIELEHFKGEDADESYDSFFDTSVPAPINMRTIRACSVKPTVDSVEMTICHAVAILCVSRSLDPEYYTNDILDKVIIFGNELANECITNAQVCFKDFDLNRKTSCPDEINWKFQLNNSFTNVQMDIFQRGVIKKGPCPVPNLLFALEEFFNYYSIGILCTRDFVVALWKEKSEYFVFYPYAIDEQGIVKKYSNDAYPGLTIFKAVHDVFNNILTNTQQQEGTFELRTCNILMTDDVEDAAAKYLKRRKNKKEICVLPAVMMRDLPEFNEDKPCKEEKSELIEKLKSKSGSREGFIKYSRGSFLVGKLSKNSKCLNESVRKYHAQSICIYFAALSSIKDIKCWSASTLDTIIESGSSLYVESSVFCDNTEVDITEIMTPLLIASREITVKAEPCLKIALEDMVLEQLRVIFEEFLPCYRACYVTRKWECWGVMFMDGVYYLFDPLGISVPGKKKMLQHAVLFRFCSIEKLVQQLIENIQRVFKGDNDAETCLTIGGISVKVDRAPCREKEKRKIEKKTRKTPVKSSRDMPVFILKELPRKCPEEISDCEKSPSFFSENFFSKGLKDQSVDQ